MYKPLTMGGKEYRLEYSIEATLYKDCVENLMEFFGNAYGLSGEEELTKGMSAKEAVELRVEMVKNSLKGMSNLANVCLTSLYAGLMKHHGRRGDKTVMSLDDTMDLMETYFEEHTEDGTGNSYDLLMLCFEQMNEDSFFDKTGLTKMFSQTESENKPNRATRRATAKATGSKS